MNRLFSVSFAAAAFITSSLAVNAATPSLGAAGTFAVLGSSTVTNTGPTIIDGDLGVSPGTAITGFPPGSVINGAIYTGANALAVQAHADTMTTYTFLKNEASGTNLTGQNLGGLTLNPGVYTFNTSAQLTGTLFLNTGGDANAPFHFQIGTTFTTASLASVVILGLGGAPDPNIFWQVGSSATLGLNTALEGTIIAQASITLTTGAGIRGRALAIDGAVTMDSNNVSASPAAPALSLGTYWKGATSNLWSQTNWSTDASGANNTNLPVSGANVIFSVTGVTPINQTTILDSNANIASLTVNDSVPVSISGPNTLTISGASGVTGITVNSGAGLTTIATNVVLAGASQTITVDNNAGLLMSGVIGGTIGLTKSGSGTLTLTGTNTYTGLTRLDSGALFMEGSVVGNALAAGGTLRGRGTISGNLDAANNSVTNPGNVANPAGTLSIGGNYTQGSGVTYVANLVAPGTNNVLAMGGQSQLGGTLFVNYVNGFTAVPGDQFTILTSTLGVSGQYAQFIDPKATGTLLTLGVVYLPTSVLLEFVQGSFRNPPPGIIFNCGASDFTPNQISVALALDKLARHNPNSALVGELDTLPLQMLPGAYDLLAPLDFTAIFDAGFASAQVQSGNIERRLEAIRDSSTGFRNSDVAVSDAHGSVSVDGKDATHTIDREGKNVVAAVDVPFSPSWGFFVLGTGQWVDIENTCHANGTDFFTSGVTAGADYRLTNHFALGLTTGYANTRSDGFGEGKVDHNNANANAYMTWFDHGFYVNGIVGGGHSFYDTKRETVGGLARGDTEGSDFTGSIGTGYEHHIGGFTVGPIASAQYTTVSIDGFTEKGSLAPLHVNNQSENSLQSRVGARASYALKMGNVIVTPEVRAQWQHEFQSTSRAIGANFAEDPTTSFTVHGPQIGRDSLLLDVGASAQVSSRVSLFAYYTGNMGAANYTAHAVNGGVGISF